MRWTDLAFLHWPISPDALRDLVPRELDIDMFDGHAWLGVVPFRMERVRLRGAPPVPTAHEFPELNVRTYVRDQQRGGVWFFSLDAASRLAVRGARLLYNLPYFTAEMTIVPEGAAIRYRSRRAHRGAPPADFDASYTPVSSVYQADPGTLEHFLVERYRLFTHSARRGLGYIEIDHAPWPLQRGAATIAINTMARASGVDLPPVPPVVHCASLLDVVAWTRQPAEPRR
jgi:uncharacterized protein